jgi:hypothetical protein
MVSGSTHVNRARCRLALLSAALASAPVFSQEDTARGSFELGGTHRARYETLDPQFRAGFSNTDQALALQTTVTFDWRRDGVQVFGEIMDSRHERNDAGSLANGTTTNALEPVQAYVAWNSGHGTWRVGRVTQDFGKRRVFARNRYRNTVSTFTGLDWSWSGERSQAARAFYWVPHRILPADLPSVLDNDHELDRDTRHSSIKGFFYQFPTFANALRLESYVFDYELDSERDPTAAADHVSLGARAYRPPRPGEWSYEVEAVLQRGDSGGTVGGVARSDLAHRASFLHLEIGYQLDLPWAPNLLFQYDRATGDEDPTDARIDRFNTLFGARRFDFGPTGIYGIAARSNIDSPGVRLTFRPAPRWQGMLSYRSLRLAEPRDAWAGSGWREASGTAGDSIGRHLEGSFAWDAIADRLSIEAGFAHLWAGRFARQTAGATFRGDPQYFYGGVTITF